MSTRGSKKRTDYSIIFYAELWPYLYGPIIITIEAFFKNFTSSFEAIPNFIILLFQPTKKRVDIKTYKVEISSLNLH